MCFRRFWNDPLGEMSLEQFKGIFDSLEEFPALETVYLGGIGEPTIHPDFINIVKLVKEAGYRLEFGTNSTQLAKYADSLINYGVDKIMVSIDAPEPAIYRDIRGTDFFGIEDNILAIQKRKKELGRNLPEIGIEVVPCYRFLHSYTEFIFGRKKEVIAHSFGNVFKEKLSDIWTSKDYEVFRYNVKNAIYPSCTDCSLRNVCDFTKDTEFDCWGDNPSCADCLWARGISKCP